MLCSASNTDPVDVSVVVAAHNEELLLPRCLDAIERQHGDARVELIVVDNLSTDGTAAIALGRPYVRLVRESTLGAVHAKAAGVRAARGAIVAVIDADSVCPPDWLERIVTRFRKEPELVGLTGPARYVDGCFWAPALVWIWYAWWRLVALVSRRAVYAVGANVAFRRSAYERSAGFDTRVLVGGDEIALFSALAKIGHTRFDKTLVVQTDARRMNVGFLRFSWEVFFLRYVVNYTYFRLTGRSLLTAYRPGSSLAKVRR